MARWVSSQGLFFLLRHGIGASGVGATRAVAWTSLLIRLLVFLVLGVILIWVLLMKRAELGSFRGAVSGNAAEALGAGAVHAGEFERSRGALTIGKVLVEGGPESFFHGIEARKVRAKMGLLDGVTRRWEGKKIGIDKLRVVMRDGAEGPWFPREVFDALAIGTSGFRIEGVSAAETDVQWGRAGRGDGVIRGARLDVRPHPDGWDLEITGGTFSRAWIQNFDIERIGVEIRRDGMEVTDARLHSGEGVLEFSLDSRDGPDAGLAGEGSFEGLPLESLVDPAFREFLGGAVSGRFRLSGALGPKEGVAIDAEVELQGDDRIELFDRLPVLRAIAAVDRLRSYKKVRFSEGSFVLRIDGSEMQAEDIDLVAADMAWLKGAFTLRQAPDIRWGPLLPDDQGPKGAGRSVGSTRPGRGPEPLPSVDGLPGNQGREPEPRVEGVLRLGVAPDAFARSARLERLYPMDEEERIRWLELPLEGDIDDLGMALADEVHTRSRAARE